MSSNQSSWSYCEQAFYKLFSRGSFEAVFERSSDQGGKNAAQLPFGLSYNFSIIWLPVGGHHVSCRVEQQKNCSFYMKLAEVLCIDSPSYLLSADCSATSALTENYMEMNHPKNFVSYSQRSHLARMKRDDRMNNAILSIQRSVVV